MHFFLIFPVCSSHRHARPERIIRFSSDIKLWQHKQNSGGRAQGLTVLVARMPTKSQGFLVQLFWNLLRSTWHRTGFVHMSIHLICIANKRFKVPFNQCSPTRAHIMQRSWKLLGINLLDRSRYYRMCQLSSDYRYYFKFQLLAHEQKISTFSPIAPNVLQTCDANAQRRLLISIYYVRLSQDTRVLT